MRNAIVIIYSRGVLQPSGIRRFGNGVSQLFPLRPVLGNGNGDPLIEFLRNSLTSTQSFRSKPPGSQAMDATPDSPSCIRRDPTPVRQHIY